MIAVVNYGAGDLHSVVKALERVGAPIQVTDVPEVVDSADAVILPGVGAARDTMSGLRRGGLVEPLKYAVQRGKPFLGVCIGMQVLLTSSEEDGGSECLGIVDGAVRRLPPIHKVPHMGWNIVKKASTHPALVSLPEAGYFYFVHSYYVDPADPGVVGGSTDYGIEFCSVIAHDNLVATQFHPEKSGELGVGLYADFCRFARQL